MKNNLNKKNIWIIALVVVIIIILGIVIFLNVPSRNKISKKSLEESLQELGVKFYEEHYYLGLEDKNQLANFNTTGINIDLNSLNVIVPLETELKEQLDKQKCSLDNTKIHIYPKDPYDVKDYNIKVELVCED